MAASTNQRLQVHFQRLICDENAPGGLEARLEMMEAMRSASVQDARALDGMMLRTIFDHRYSIKETQTIH